MKDLINDNRELSLQEVNLKKKGYIMIKNQENIIS